MFGNLGHTAAILHTWSFSILTNLNTLSTIKSHTSYMVTQQIVLVIRSTISPLHTMHSKVITLHQRRISSIIKRVERRLQRDSHTLTYQFTCSSSTALLLGLLIQYLSPCIHEMMSISDIISLSQHQTLLPWLMFHSKTLKIRTELGLPKQRTQNTNNAATEGEINCKNKIKTKE